MSEFDILNLFIAADEAEYWENAGGPTTRPPNSAPNVPRHVSSLVASDLIEIQNEAMCWQAYATSKIAYLHQQEKMADERATQLKAKLRKNMSGSAADKSDKLRENMTYMVEYAKAEGFKIEKEKFQALESRMKGIVELCHRAIMSRRDTL